MSIKIKDKNNNDIEIYTNSIDVCISDFCTENNIEDIRKESQSVWNACLMYIYRHCFYNTDRLKDNTLHYNGSVNTTYNRYNYELLYKLCEYYLYLCSIYDKEISVNGYSYMTGISRETLASWNRPGRDKASSTSSEIIKILLSSNEESLVNRLYSSKSNPVGIIAMLNHRHGWQTVAESHGITKKALNADELPKLSQIEE